MIFVIESITKKVILQSNILNILIFVLNTRLLYLL